MTQQDIATTVNTFLEEEFEIEASRLVPEARLREDLGIDSLEVVDIIVAVQEHFSFKPSVEQMKQAKTLADFYSMIQSNVQ